MISATIATKPKDKCPRCGGSYFHVNDEDGSHWDCIMCGQPAVGVVKRAVEEEPKKLGRPRTGGHAKCEDCGVGIYIRRHRLEDEKTFRCRKCASRLVAKAPRGTYKIGAYYDQHRDEILANRLTIGHRATLRKWGIAQSSWINLKFRWRSEGVEVQDLTRVPNCEDKRRKNYEKEKWIIEDKDVDEFLEECRNRKATLQDEIQRLDGIIDAGELLLKAYRDAYSK